MRFLKFVPLLLLAVLVSACSTTGSGVHSDDYIKQSQSVHPMLIPAGVAMPKQKPYYRVPAVAVRSGNASPSLLPPGSKVLQYRASKHHVQTTGKVFARLNKSATRLTLSLNAKNAWPVVGRALQKTRYQVMDKDSGMGTYFLLDTEKTGNKITQSTPIYRLVIKKAGKKSRVSVMNQKNHLVDAGVAMRILSAVKKNLS